jgi:hypothetical protein
VCGLLWVCIGVWVWAFEMVCVGKCKLCVWFCVGVFVGVCECVCVSV